MVSVCLPSDALLQHLPSYLGFSCLGRVVSLHGCSSKAQPLLLTLKEGYLLTATPPDLEREWSSSSWPSCAPAAVNGGAYISSSSFSLNKHSEVHFLDHIIYDKGPYSQGYGFPSGLIQL